MQAYFHFDINHQPDDSTDESGQGKLNGLTWHISAFPVLPKLFHTYHNPEIPDHTGDKWDYPIFLCM